MSGDRSERLRRRRKGAGERDEPTEPGEQAEPDKTDKPDKTDEQSIKDERGGGEVYMWLPDEQKQRMTADYKRKDADLASEGLEFEKIRHYYPLVVEHGLATVEEWSTEELKAALRDEGLLVG